MSSDLNTPKDESESATRYPVRTPEQLTEELRNLRREYKEMESLRHLADTMPQMVWIARPDGYYEYYNKHWWDYTGLVSEQSQRDAWNRVLHPDDVTRDEVRWQQALSSGRPYEIELRLRRASDGMYRWFLGRALPQRDHSGNVVKWFGTCTDIHDQKLAQEALQKAKEEVEALNRHKDQFLAVVSHELRTPLNAVLGWTQLIKAGILDEMEWTEAITAIERNARAQARLIEDVLDISRIINNKLRVERRVVAVANSIAAALDAVRPMAEEKRVKMEWQNHHDELLVYADPARVQQIVWNLLTNAVRFTPSGGTVKMLVDRHMSCARIRVVDSGRGITADFLPYVFDRFRQADSSSTRQHSGLGLGLAIAKHLVDLHEGMIAVQSEGEDCGTTFTVMLPVVAIDTRVEEATPEESEIVMPSRDALAGIRVLVVDDEKSARDLIGTALEKFGADVIIEESARAAYTRFLENPPDVLVSDVAMPGLDGYSLIKLVRNLAPSSGGQAPAIALTAFTSLQDRRKALELGFNLHLAKPVEPAALIQAVAALAHDALV